MTVVSHTLSHAGLGPASAPSCGGYQQADGQPDAHSPAQTARPTATAISPPTPAPPPQQRDLRSCDDVFRPDGDSPGGNDPRGGVGLGPIGECYPALTSAVSAGHRGMLPASEGVPEGTREAQRSEARASFKSLVEATTEGRPKLPQEVDSRAVLHAPQPDARGEACGPQGRGTHPAATAARRWREAPPRHVRATARTPPPRQMTSHMMMEKDLGPNPQDKEGRPGEVLVGAARSPQTIW